MSTSAHDSQATAEPNSTDLSAIQAPVDSSILGATLMDGGVRFALWAPRATRVEVALVNPDGQVNHDLTRNPDGVWVTHVPGVEPGQTYGFRVHGEWNPNKGMRFNPARLLLDPYARAITAGVDYLGPILDHTAESDYEIDTTDSSQAVPLSVVVADTPAPTPLSQRRSKADSVVYEMHLKGYTQLHPQVPEHLRGTYAGMTYPAVIEHLQGLGITAVELLPIHHFISEPFLVGRGLTNYWGYNTMGFFAPHAAYSYAGTRGEQVAEFKAMVSALHEAGIEVILDVVYNHTGEGGHQGPTLSFRGIDHRGYYRLTDDLRNDYDVTGTGNSVDTSNPGVLQMVIDSMKYWVTEMGVDGFRFDLGTTLIRDRDHHVDQNHQFKQLIADDPVFENIKMIAEPWDVGPFGYQVGNWGQGWSEWNDQYRNFMRDFWRGQISGVQELATRVAGSADIFQASGRGPEASVNFITAHDGFTMRDLVSYDGKHNEANGEENRDGADDNRSWNHGAEGETEDPNIIAERHRAVKNMMATMLLSHGIPMITAGDEMGRTQDGNNNAYCQDSPISWIHWDSIEDWGDVTEMTRALLQLRRENPFVQHDEYGEESEDAPNTTTVSWFRGDGFMTQDDWHDGGRRHLGMLSGDSEDLVFTWFHNGQAGVEVTMPRAEELPEGVPTEDRRFSLVACSAEEIPSDLELELGASWILPHNAVAVFKLNTEHQSSQLVNPSQANTDAATGHAGQAPDEH